MCIIDVEAQRSCFLSFFHHILYSTIWPLSARQEVYQYTSERCCDTMWQLMTLRKDNSDDQ